MMRESERSRGDEQGRRGVFAAASGWYLGMPLGRRLAAAFVLGAAAGWVAGPHAAVLEPVGEGFIRLLKALVLPIVAFTILAGLSGIPARKLGRAAAAVLLLYVTTALAATVIGVGFALWIRPGAGLSVGVGSLSDQAAPISAARLLGELIPDNVTAAVAEGRLLPVILFTVLFAVALAKLGRTHPAATTLAAIFDTCVRATHIILGWFMELAPIGTFALVAIAFGRSELGAALAFAKLLAAVYAGQAAVILCAALLLVLFGIAPASFFRGTRDALVTAFVTSSSAAALPLEMEAAEHRLHVDRGVSGFALPLGIGIHKIGTAVHLAGACVFAAGAAALELTPARVAVITVAVFLGSIATPPVSGGAMMVMGAIFQQAGLPLEVIGLVIATPLLGKLNTPVNSMGRLACTAIAGRVALKRNNLPCAGGMS